MVADLPVSLDARQRVPTVERVTQTFAKFRPKATFS